ncbi:unnamed protein product [Chilo suppressalis]|uniref:Lysozyme n=1 Tax=Chilo suppressalis TaxID=168631 RepID=A0ABN8AZX1_CHISP|nr:unnamed protein product [Chilo suppressalis]
MFHAASWTCALIVLASARVYERCELARELLSLGVQREDVSTWVCIAYHESRLDTSARNYGSGDHGLLQISELYWCGPGKACGLPCSDLRNADIADDVQCALQIREEHDRLQGDGFLAWVVYSQHCKHNTKKYIVDCDSQMKNVPVKTTSKSRHLDIHNSTRFEYNPNIDNLKPPYLVAINSIFRGQFGKVLQETGQKSARNNWLNYKVDNIDDLRLPMFNIDKNNEVVQLALTSPHPTSSQTSAPTTERPWKRKYIETKQFRKRIFTQEKQPTNEEEIDKSSPSYINDVAPKFIYNKYSQIITTTSKPANVVTATSRFTKPVTTSSRTLQTVTSTSKRALTIIATNKPAIISTSTSEPAKIVTSTYKPAINVTATSVPAKMETTTSKIVKVVTPVKNFVPFTSSASKHWTFSTRPSSFSKASQTYKYTPDSTSRPITTVFSRFTNTRPTTTKNSKTVLTTTVKPPTFIFRSYNQMTLKPIISNKYTFLATTTKSNRDREPRAFSDFKTLSTITTRKLSTVATATENYRKAITQRPVTTKATQSIFDLYLNPTKAPQLRTYKFPQFDNGVHKLKIFSDGTTTPAPKLYSNTRNYVRRQT